MNAAQIAVIETCVTNALTGALSFPAIVGQLMEIGVERYHVDYCRHAATYYLASGESHVVAVPHPAQPIAYQFAAAEVEAAIRASQRNEHTYPDFLRKTMAAGCVGYVVCLTGRQALYFGRRGELHREPFPTAKA